jgi:hypothetical protein
LIVSLDEKYLGLRKAQAMGFISMIESQDGKILGNSFGFGNIFGKMHIHYENNVPEYTSFLEFFPHSSYLESQGKSQSLLTNGEI